MPEQDAGALESHKLGERVVVQSFDEVGMIPDHPRSGANRGYLAVDDEPVGGQRGMKHRFAPCPTTEQPRETRRRG